MSNKRFTVTLEPVTLARLDSVKERFGLSMGEQVRRGIELWLESQEWPARNQKSTRSTPHDGRTVTEAFERG
jgi:hypothetical protein